ncbi:MAG TPA: Lrp/AsnC ligand binding domain-containing protein [Kaistia sp.]|nr:Lrp/AsnC ligand binding domain-containing protein [Kaistia sp.]
MEAREPVFGSVGDLLAGCASNVSQDQADAFAEAVLSMPEVVACHLVSGDVDFLIEVVVPDMVTYEATILRQLLSLTAIRDIRSSFAMRG